MNPTGTYDYTVTLRFFGELNDFLDAERRNGDLVLILSGRRSVKDLIESVGVPHVEIARILINGHSSGFEQIIADGDCIAVHPGIEAFHLEIPAAFVLDVHLGKLARSLRLLGFDTDYLRYRDDAELAAISEKQNRILLTRDLQLLKRRNITRGLFVRNSDPEKQISEVLNRLCLWKAVEPLNRCIGCNGSIESIPDTPDLDSLVPPGVRTWCQEYYRCRGCGRIYWEGSHYKRMLQRIEGMLRQDPSGSTK